VALNSAKLSLPSNRRIGFCSAILVLMVPLASVRVVGAAEPSTVVYAITHGQRQASTEPVRLPPIDALMHEPAAGIEPFAFTPIASFDLFDTQGPSALSLGVGMPGDAKPSIGGWISFGYSGRGLGN
jgi:hypothetical protein